MKKLNNYICWGVFFNGIWIFSNRFNLLPDFIEGVIVGAGILLILIGMCFEKYDISNVKNYKKNLFKRITTK
jgi:hypothetical protein